MTNMKPSREDIAELLKARYNLTDIQVTNVLETAYSLSEQRDKANDFAVAHYLNERAIALFSLVANNNNTPDTTAINRSYILITDTLKRLYARNPELQGINMHICWQTFDRLEYIHNELWEYTNDSNSDYGQSHNAQVNRLCIINGKEKPDIAPDIKKILDEANRNVNAFIDELEDEDEPEVYDGKYIPAYTVSYKDDGTILVNDVLKLKKLQAGQASDMIMSQSLKHDGQPEPFKPVIATKRQLTTIIGEMGFDKTLRAIFFPTISKDKGIVFRSRVTRIKADAQHINTKHLDKKLKQLGAVTENEPDRPIDLSEIPF
ncbi:MAG: hypothetical protein WAQ27_04570 [Candidatus Microsaccharimonas sp.]